MKVVPGGRNRGPQAEREAMERLMARLARVFPEISRVELERVVRGDYCREPERDYPAPASQRTA